MKNENWQKKNLSLNLDYEVSSDARSMLQLQQQML